MTDPVSRNRVSGSYTTPKGDYTVKKGDTLSELAEQFKVTVEDLLKANPQIVNRDVIREGAQLNIPKPSAPSPTTGVSGTTTTRSDYVKPTAVERDRNSGPIRVPERVTAAGLDGVRSGDVVLSNGAQGPAVKQAQELLIKNGYPLKRFGADGDFGGETEAAVKKFQTANGLPDSGKIDKDTLVKLEAGAKQNVKYPEYDKLFADGVLKQTIAVGYDEGGWHKIEGKKLVDGLVKQGYESVDVSKMTDAEIKSKLGVDASTINKDSTYFVKHFQYNGKDVTAIAQLITPDDPNAKQKFARAMSEDEVVLYGGHGRYGSGPDFDDIHSPAGNFHIGDPFEKGHVTLGDYDLPKTKMTKDYQFMFFHGCNTRLYIDDLRQKKGSSNLDVIGTKTELWWDKTADDLLAMTGGLTSGKSVDELHTQLNQINTGNEGDDKVKDKFKFDGFQDNAVQTQRQ